MPGAPKNANRYKQDQQRDYLRTFVLREKGGGIVSATNSVYLAAEKCGGKVEEAAPGIPLNKAAKVTRPDGPPRIYVSAKEPGYRAIYLQVLEALGYDPDSVHRSDHIDHALPKILAAAHYEMVLINCVASVANTSHGASIEKSSIIDRRFNSKAYEVMSCIELFKILEAAPVKEVGIVEHLLIGIINITESGLCEEAGLTRGQAADAIMESIRSSDNNIVSDAYNEHAAAIEEEFQKIRKDLEN